MINLPLYEQWSQLNEIGDSTAKTFKWKAVTNMKSWLTDIVEGTKGKRLDGSWEDRSYQIQTPFEYKFQSDSKEGTSYHVKIGGYSERIMRLSFGSPKPKPKNQINYTLTLGLGFGVDGIEDDPETNLNEQFRVMATVVECALDFIHNILKQGPKAEVGIKEFYMNPKLDKEGQKGYDSRRGKLYAAYIRNAFQRLKTDKDFYIKQYEEGFVLQFGTVRYADGSVPPEVIARTFQ